MAKRKMDRRKRHTSKRITLQELWDRDNGICAYCGQYVDITDASRDHKVPRSKGGSNKRSNLQLMHHWCNKLKANSREMAA